jgi:hypothetical protein
VPGPPGWIIPPSLKNSSLDPDVVAALDFLARLDERLRTIDTQLRFGRRQLLGLERQLNGLRQLVVGRFDTLDRRIAALEALLQKR